MKLPLPRLKTLLILFTFLTSVFLNQCFAQDTDNDGIPDAQDNCPSLSNIIDNPRHVFESDLVDGTYANSNRVGAKFIVNNAITVTDLGAYDDQLDGFSTTITVAIVNVLGNVVAGPVYFNGNAYTTSTRFRFQPIIPVVLEGGEYFIVATGYNTNESAGQGSDLYYTGDGNISLQWPASGGSGIGIPENQDVNYVHAGNFNYNRIVLQFPDNDNDGFGDPCDEDDDNDGILDNDDPCPFSYGIGGGSTVTVLAQDEAHFHQNNIDGDVGVWLAGKSAKIHESTIVNGSVTASVIDISNDSEVNGATNYTNAAPPSTPFVYNGTPEPLLDITIPDNYPGTYDLYGSNFRKITVGKNSTLKFMATDNITIKELFTKDANVGSFTSIIFNGNTNLLIRKKADFGKRTSINYGGTPKVVIYVEQSDVHVGQSSRISANMDLRFTNLIVEDGVEDVHTEMRGLFIAKKVDSKKWVHWYGGGGCGISTNQRAASTRTETKRIALTYVNELNASVYPNPSTAGFTINITGSGDQPVTVKITDLMGQVIKHIITEPNTKTITTGADLKAGIYFAEIKQGNASKVAKLIKLQ